MITFRRLTGFGRAGIGNKLFQYAGTRLYATMHGYHAAFPAWDGMLLFSGLEQYTLTESLRSFFLPTRQLDDLRSWNRWQRILYELGLQRKLPSTHAIETLHTHPRDNVNFYGYFQDLFSRDLLRTSRNLVRSWLPLHDSLNQWADETIKHHDPWIGVHVRRGDFVKLGLSVSLEHYQKALERYPGQQIYISSNDHTIQDSFRGYRLIKPENPFPELPTWAFDFLMLTKSQHLIGCGSTFSWWAAYLGGHETYTSPPLAHEWLPGYTPHFSEQAL